MALRFDRALGALLGTLLGDAIGRPFEGASPGPSLERQLERRLAAPRALSYSDDGEMTLALGDAIRRTGRVDADAILDAMARRHEPARVSGKGARAAFRARQRGVSRAEAVRVTWAEGSRGNGAAVRVAPIALFEDTEGAVIAAARESAGATHAHEEAKAAAAVVALAIFRATRDHPTLFEDAPPERPGPPSVFALDSVRAAAWAVTGAGDAASAITRAILLGGDTDSVGAISGAVAGARFGASTLPDAWLTALEPGARREATELATWLATPAAQRP